MIYPLVIILYYYCTTVIDKQETTHSFYEFMFSILIVVNDTDNTDHGIYNVDICITSNYFYK